MTIEMRKARKESKYETVAQEEKGPDGEPEVESEDDDAKQGSTFAKFVLFALCVMFFLSLLNAPAIFRNMEESKPYAPATYRASQRVDVSVPATTNSSITKATRWSALGTVIQDAQHGDQFGQSISLSGDASMLAVGAPMTQDSNNKPRGRVSIYAWNGIDWERMGDLLGSRYEQYFGSNVALSGDGKTVVVGSLAGDGKGLLQVFVRQGKRRWIRKGPGKAGAGYGMSVAISSDGTTVATSTINASHVHKRDDHHGRWTQKGDSMTNSKITGGECPLRLALSGDGNTVAFFGTVGTPAVVYRYITGTGWQQVGQVFPGNVTAVALNYNGNRVAVGSMIKGKRALNVFSNNSKKQWVQVHSDIHMAQEGSASVSSLAMSHDGTVLVVGSNSTGRVGVIVDTKFGWTEVFSFKGRPERLLVDLSDDGKVIMSGGQSSTESDPQVDPGFISVFRAED